MTLALAAALALVATGSFVQLAPRLGVGKTERRDGPRSHLAKAGTPTLGGIAFLVAAVAAWWLSGPDPDGAALVALTLGAGVLGLVDDLVALRRRRRREAGHEDATGLLARYRIALQTAVAAAFAVYAVTRGHTLLGSVWVDVPIYTFVIVGSINALNFTDGLDGLAAGVSAVALLFFLGSPFAAALLGALLGFLWYNAHPARVFMGGVGSEALGAALAGLAIVADRVWYLPLIALVPVLEVLSVVVQVTWFRLSGGQRLLRMSPLHHHFELAGWSEPQVVARFVLVTGAAVALAAGLAGGAA